jgi:hypothetical protein
MTHIAIAESIDSDSRITAVFGSVYHDGTKITTVTKTFSEQNFVPCSTNFVSS